MVNMNFKPDEQVKERPKCRCGQPGIILVGHWIMCGKCVMNWQERRDKMIFETTWGDD